MSLTATEHTSVLVSMFNIHDISFLFLSLSGAPSPVLRLDTERVSRSPGGFVAYYAAKLVIIF